MSVGEPWENEQDEPSEPPNFSDSPNGELQPIIDHLERSVNDEQGMDFDDEFDWDA